MMHFNKLVMPSGQCLTKTDNAYTLLRLETP